MSPNVSKVGGAAASGTTGGPAYGVVYSSLTRVDPDNWVVSLFRALKNYIEASFDSDIYNIQFGFPSANDIGDYMPLDKTLIHFEIDDINNVKFGFGDNIVDSVINEDDGSITEHEVRCHIINFDVGIWSSKRSGGVTARLEAYQLLNDLFVGPSAFESLRSLGIELMNFSGGNFIKEEIDDISVFRVMGMILEVRVYSRKVRTPIPYIHDFVLNPQVIDIEEIVITE